MEYKRYVVHLSNEEFAKKIATTAQQFERSSWYFGAMTREYATELLMNEKKSGVFLVRDSRTKSGDFALSVKCNSQVKHHIINKLEEGDQIRYRSGRNIFSDIPSILAYLKLRGILTTLLVRPVPKKQQRVIALYNYEEKHYYVLPFRQGEILTILSKDEEQWWTARNSVGQIGYVPYNYIQEYNEDDNLENTRPEFEECVVTSSNLEIPIQPSRQEFSVTPTKCCTIIQRVLSAFKKIKQAKVSSTSDNMAFNLDVGDLIKVTKKNINGQWEGELQGKVGYFTFTPAIINDSDPSEEKIIMKSKEIVPKKQTKKSKFWYKIDKLICTFLPFLTRPAKSKSIIDKA